MKNLITSDEKFYIDSMCDKYKISKYTINSDGSVDVDGDVVMEGFSFGSLPLQFGKVTGNFSCGYTKKLTSLQGAPHTVGGSFYCILSDNLASLIGGPLTVGNDYVCSNNALITLEGSPNEINGSFKCGGNKLTSLMGCPSIILGNFHCASNRINTLLYVPEIIGGGFTMQFNELESTYSGNTDMEVGGVFHCNRNKLPQMIMDNSENLRIVVKYQRHFSIWNDDLTLNVAKFQELLDEIKEGLE